METPSTITTSEKAWAFFAIFFSILGAFAALIFKKDNDYIMFYAKQSFALFFISLAMRLTTFVILTLPNMIAIHMGHSESIKLIEMVFSIVMLFAVWIPFFILVIIGLLYAVSGEKKYIPLVGAMVK